MAAKPVGTAFSGLEGHILPLRLPKIVREKLMRYAVMNGKYRSAKLAVFGSSAIISRKCIVM